MKLLRSWIIKGSDGKIYTIEERERPGIRINGKILPSGVVEYILDNGEIITDERKGYWETMSGVLIEKPEDIL